MQDTYAVQHTGPTDIYDTQVPLSQSARVVNTFIAPSKTFADLRRNRSWWLPYVLLAVFSYVFAAAALMHVGVPRLAEGALRNNPAQAERMQQATPEQRAQTVRITGAIMKGALLSSPLLLLLFSALGALLLWVGFNFILGGTATFPGMFAVMMFAWLPSIVRSVLTTVMLFLGDTDSFNLNDPIGTNPAFYLSADSAAWLRSLLGSVDVFTLWILALTALGGAIVARVRVRSGFVLVFAAWLIVVLLKSGVAAATS